MRTLFDFPAARGAALAAAGLLLAGLGACSDPDATGVYAAGETHPVTTEGDAADDPAIWVHPNDAEQSLLFGTNKKGALSVYDLSGALLQEIEGNFNNVDVRTGVAWGGREAALVVACERRSETVVLFEIDAAARRLVEPKHSRVALGIDPEGLCLYRSAASGLLYAFACGFDLQHEEQDWLEQWELTPREDGEGVAGRMVRRIPLASGSEGLVADDARALVYLAEEHVGIWRFPADPAGGVEGELLSRMQPEGPLWRDVEGLALAPAADGPGYLVASCQGVDDFVVLDRARGYESVGRFEVKKGRGFDRVTYTDGIDLVLAPVGARFPRGLLVVQDHENDDGNQNFKLVSWGDVHDALALR